MRGAPLIDANELLSAALVLASLVRVHRNVIPAVRDQAVSAATLLAGATKRQGQQPSGPHGEAGREAAARLFGVERPVLFQHRYSKPSYLVSTVSSVQT